MKNRYTLMLLFKYLQVSGVNCQGENITIPRFHFLCSTFYIYIQHFKLHKHWNWAINVYLMLKLKMFKNNSKRIRTSGERVVFEIQTHQDWEGGLKIRDLGDVLYSFVDGNLMFIKSVETLTKNWSN